MMRGIGYFLGATLGATLLFFIISYIFLKPRKLNNHEIQGFIEISDRLLIKEINWVGGILSNDEERLGIKSISKMTYFSNRNMSYVRATTYTYFSKELNKYIRTYSISKGYFGEVLLDFGDKDKVSQQSQLFPNINLKINVVKSVVSNDESTTTYRLVGTLDRENLNENEMKNLYEKFYQPIIKFSFTEFDYIYRITYEVDNETGQLLKSTASLKEFVKNNYDVITKFELRKVEL